MVTGNVVSRSGLQLTVKGATLMRAAGSVAFNDELDIQLSDDTTVSRQLSINQVSINDISVGQRITVFGALDSGETQMDAADGHVQGLGDIHQRCAVLEDGQDELVGELPV